MSLVSRSAIWICALVTFSATALASQVIPTVAPPSNDARKASVMSQLAPRARIRVATSDRGVIEGRYTRVESESLVLYSVGSRHAARIPLAQIDTLWIRTRDHGKGFFMGALIGGAVGASGVALLAYSITHATREACNCVPVVAGTVGVSAFIGGVIGAATGWPGWHQRWPQ
jgi:hypothetical protein